MAMIRKCCPCYDVDSDLLRSEKAIFEEINANHAYAQTKNAAVIVKRMYENGVSEVLPCCTRCFQSWPRSQQLPALQKDPSVPFDA